MAANPKQADTLIPDLDQAERFLSLLDPEADTFTFQTFDDVVIDGKKRGNKSLASTRHGELTVHADHLRRFQARGAGAFVMVNEGDGIVHPGNKSCRTIANVKRIRAIFQEDDGDGTPPPIEPHIVVQSSPGKFHRYWLCDGLTNDDFTAVMNVMVGRYGSDKDATGLNRVLRIPGFYHQKGDPFMVHIVDEPGGLPYTRDQIMEAFKPAHDACSEKSYKDQGNEHRVHVDAATIRDLRSALNALRADDRHLWVQVGQNLRKLGDVGRELWLTWSQSSDKYNALDASSKWESFSGTESGYEAVFSKAQQAGWVNPAAKISQPAYPSGEDDLQPEEAAANDPVAFPDPYPGFMEAICRNGLDTAIIPQPHLTTLSTLMGMASCCGGRYHLPDGMRLNLYGVGIAASGWGKEHARKIGCAVADAGGADVKGKPGSGQGLEDLLTDHCALLLEIDEVAHLFEAMNGKVRAPHLIELSGGLLRLFSASGDSYRTRVLASVKGLPKPRSIINPCVSLMGFSTPEKLGEVLTTMNIEDGLMGRVLFAHGVGGIRPGDPTTRFEIGDVESIADSVAKANADQIHIDQAKATLSADLTTHAITIDQQAGRNLKALQLEFWEAGESSQSVWSRALMVRSYEKAKRIAGVLAVWDKPIHPILTSDHVEWAAQMVKASNQTCADFVAKHMHGGKVAANAARLMDYVNRILKGEFRYETKGWKYAVERESFVPLAMLLRQSKMDKPDFDLSISHLVDAERLVKHDKYERWVKPW